MRSTLKQLLAATFGLAKEGNLGPSAREHLSRYQKLCLPGPAQESANRPEGGI